MKLYNVYRLCKQNLYIIESATAKKDEKSGLFVISTWPVVQDHFELIKKIPSFKDCINDYISSVPVLVREHVSPQIDSSTAQKLNTKLNRIVFKMNTIIELYEGMGLEETSNGLDIKLPPCDNLKNYISYLKDIDFIFLSVHFCSVKTKFLNLSL